MQRLIVAAVLILVAVAAVDAIRNRGERGGIEDREELTAALREAGASGSLVYTDRDCTLRALALPALEKAPLPEGAEVGCTFELSPGGERIAPGGAVWTASPAAYAICRGIVVSVYAPPDGRARFAYDGCAPAWRPDRPGTLGSNLLTVVRGGRVLEVRPACDDPPPCERTLVSRDAILEAAVRHPNVPVDVGTIEDVDVRDVAWLSPTRAALLVDVDVARVGEQQLLALYGSGAPVATRALLSGREALALDVSPTGAVIAVDPGLVLRSDGSELTLPRPLQRGAASFAWSPDDSWLAVSTRASVFLLRTHELEAFDGGGPSPRLIEIPVAVRDLGWGGRVPSLP